MSSVPSRARATAWVLVIVAVLFYAPLAFTYFFNGPTGPNLQDRVFDLLMAPGFAFGLGSGHDGNFRTFASSYTTMWIHSVVGTATLLAGLSQFSTRIRTRHPRVHRTLGKVFIAGCLGVGITAASYLLRTPDDLMFSGVVFAEVLWALALGTMLSALLAYLSIRRRDLVAHREFVALSFALICSAGWLRLMWISLGQVWHTNKEMLNLAGSQIAAPFLVTCAILYVRPHWRGSRGDGSPLASNHLLTGVAGLSVIGGGVLLAAATQVDWAETGPAWFVSGWAPIIMLGVLPWAAHTLWLAWMAHRARLRGEVAAHAAWRAYLLGGVAAPAVGAVVLILALTVHDVPLPQVWYAVSFSWGISLTNAYLLHATLTTRWAGGPWARRPSPTRLTTPTVSR